MKIGGYEIVRQDKHNIVVGKYKQRPSDCPKGQWKKGDKYLHILGYFDDVRSALVFLYNQRLLKKADEKADVVLLVKRLRKFKKEIRELVPAIKCSDDLKYVPREISEEQREKAKERMKKMHEAKKRRTDEAKV